MGVERSESTPIPGSLNRHPVQQRPDRSKLMVPEEINGSGVQSVWRSRENSRDFRINFKEEQFRTRSGFISSSEDEADAVDDSNLRRDEMNLPTTQKSVDGALLRYLPAATSTGLFPTFCLLLLPVLYRFT